MVCVTVTQDLLRDQLDVRRLLARKLLLFGLLCLVRVGRARSVLIAQVVVGVVDPNPLVGGQGVETLEKAGIHVDVGCLERECWDINAEFMQRIKG